MTAANETHSKGYMMNADCLSVGDVARRLGVRPVDISTLFYQRRLSDDRCPIVAGRRLIPPEYLEVIAMELRRKGIDVCLPGDSCEGGDSCRR